MSGAEVFEIVDEIELSEITISMLKEKLLLAVCQPSNWDSIGGFTHYYNEDMKEIFEFLEEEGMLVPNFKDYFFDVAEDWKFAVTWLYG